MCLYCEENKPKRAEKDIVCYKRVTPITAKDGIVFLTPYLRTEIGFDVIRGDKPLKAEGKKSITDYTFDGLYSVGGGFIHTYGFLRDALEDVEMDCEINFNCEDIVIECIIPKGTYYLEGRDSFGHKGFASRKIKFTAKESISQFIDEKISRLLNYKDSIA